MLALCFFARHRAERAVLYFSGEAGAELGGADPPVQRVPPKGGAEAPRHGPGGPLVVRFRSARRSPIGVRHPPQLLLLLGVVEKDDSITRAAASWSQVDSEPASGAVGGEVRAALGRHDAGAAGQGADDADGGAGAVLHNVMMAGESSRMGNPSACVRSAAWLRCCAAGGACMKGGACRSKLAGGC